MAEGTDDWDGKSEAIQVRHLLLVGHDGRLRQGSKRCCM